MRLNIEATEPVHWSIKATVGGADLRRFAASFETVYPVLCVWLVCFGKRLTPRSPIEGLSFSMKKRRFLHG